MAVAWYLIPIVRVVASARVDDETGEPAPADDRIRRRCRIYEVEADILAAGGAWSAQEVLGHWAVVKVRLPQAGLDQLAAEFIRLPQRLLTATLSDLTNAQRRAIRDQLELMGYPLAEIQATLGTNLGNVTLAQVLRFALRRRRKVRYDAGTDSIVDDGEVIQLPADTLEVIDAAVTNGG